jgi:hypothetical protein
VEPLASLTLIAGSSVGGGWDMAITRQPKGLHMTDGILAVAMTVGVDCAEVSPLERPREIRAGQTMVRRVVECAP